MKTLNTYIEERLVLSKTRSQKIDIEIFDTFNETSDYGLTVGSILFNNDTGALFYFFNDKTRSASSQFYFYTDEMTCDELYDSDYTEQMHDAGQQGRYPNKKFRNELNNAILREGLTKVQDNSIFLREYDEILPDWGYGAPHCKTTQEKQKWIDWIKYFNKISGETLDTKIDSWEYFEI